MPLMKVQNAALPNELLKLPARDGRPSCEARGDAAGVFELDEGWGRWLIQTPGWKLVAVAPAQAAPAPAVATKVGRMAHVPSPTAPERADVPVARAAVEVPAVPMGAELQRQLAQSTADELEGLSRNELMAWAGARGIELSAEDRRLRVGELRALLAGRR